MFLQPLAPMIAIYHFIHYALYFLVYFSLFLLTFLLLQHVTASGCKNMTKCPREIWEIEAVMAGAPWPLNKTSVGNDGEQA